MIIINTINDHQVSLAGNKETLLEKPKERGVDVRDELLVFHRKYYSANLMALAVVGKGTCHLFALATVWNLVVPLNSLLRRPSKTAQ